MPCRKKPDALARAIGKRVRQLRLERKLTLEKLSYENDLASKGYLSDVEKGLARPTVAMLQQIARALGVELVDLVTFPAESDRHRLIDATRDVPLPVVRQLLADVNRRA